MIFFRVSVGKTTTPGYTNVLIKEGNVEKYGPLAAPKSCGVMTIEDDTLPVLQAALSSHPSADRAPKAMVEALEKYRDNGQPLGEFLQAVVSNDLFKSILAADDENQLRLRDLVCWMDQNLSTSLWGCYDKYALHIQNKQKERANSHG